MSCDIKSNHLWSFRLDVVNPAIVMRNNKAGSAEKFSRILQLNVTKQTLFFASVTDSWFELTWNLWSVQTLRTHGSYDWMLEKYRRLKVSKSQNKIIGPKLLPKTNRRICFSIPTVWIYFKLAIQTSSFKYFQTIRIEQKSSFVFS